MEALTHSEQEMIQLARQCGLLGPQEDPRPELLTFALAIVHACAQIGDGYWRDDADDVPLLS